MRLLSITAASIAAGVSKRSIERWLTEGRLTRYEQPGRIRVLIDADELEALIKPKPRPRPAGTHDGEGTIERRKKKKRHS